MMPSRLSKPQPRSSLSDVLHIIALDDINSNPFDSNPTISENRQIASYNWTQGYEHDFRAIPTILHPGGPAVWSTPSRSTSIFPAQGPFHHDEDTFRSPNHVMEPAVRAVNSSDVAFPSSAVDLFATDETLTDLIKFIKNEDVSFRMFVQVIGNTLFLAHGKGNDDAVPDMGYFHGLLKAYTKWPDALQYSVSHQRIVQYDFDGLNCLVRFQPDGCLSKNDQRFAGALLAESFDPFRSTKDGPQSLQLDLVTSPFNPSSFTRQLAGLPRHPTRPSQQDYHWSQVDVVVEESMQKLSQDEISNLLKAEDLELEFTSVTHFCLITGVDGLVARRYLKMADGDFQTAVSLFYDIEAADQDMLGGKPTRPQSKRQLIARLIRSTDVSPRIAAQCFQQTKGDFEKARQLCLGAQEDADLSRALGDSLVLDRATQAQRDEQVDDSARRNDARVQDGSNNIKSGVAVKTTALGEMQPSLFSLRLHNTEEEVTGIAADLSRLWVTRMPNLITAVHNHGTVTSISYQDMRCAVDAWEAENLGALGKLAELLRMIKHVVGKSTDAKVELKAQKGELQVKEACGKSGVVSEGLRDVWLERPSAVGDDAQDDDGDDGSEQDWGACEDSEEEE